MAINCKRKAEERGKGKDGRKEGGKERKKRRKEVKRTKYIRNEEKISGRKAELADPISES